jgi:hypothetical protein
MLAGRGATQWRTVRLLFLTLSEDALDCVKHIADGLTLPRAEQRDLPSATALSEVAVTGSDQCTDDAPPAEVDDLAGPRRLFTSE